MSTPTKKQKLIERFYYNLWDSRKNKSKLRSNDILFLCTNRSELPMFSVQDNVSFYFMYMFALASGTSPKCYTWEAWFKSEKERFRLFVAAMSHLDRLRAVEEFVQCFPILISETELEIIVHGKSSGAKVNELNFEYYLVPFESTVPESGKYNRGYMTKNIMRNGKVYLLGSDVNWQVDILVSHFETVLGRSSRYFQFMLSNLTFFLSRKGVIRDKLFPVVKRRIEQQHGKCEAVASAGILFSSVTWDEYNSKTGLEEKSAPCVKEALFKAKISHMHMQDRYWLMSYFAATALSKSEAAGAYISLVQEKEKEYYGLFKSTTKSVNQAKGVFFPSEQSKRYKSIGCNHPLSKAMCAWVKMKNESVYHLAGYLETQYKFAKGSAFVLAKKLKENMDRNLPPILNCRMIGETLSMNPGAAIQNPETFYKTVSEWEKFSEETKL